ncbi:Rid family hydrolase [Actinomadura sp. NPDC048032]|uniref:Rid family hydrolase n=1 Tax=Actinomadura TaxID=1988 RepID=UPI0031E7F252
MSGPEPIAVATPALPAGPTERFAYSYAVRHGRDLFVSGLVPFDPEGRIVGMDDPEAQAEQVFANLAAIMAAAQGSVDDVVETTTYCIDRNHLLAINEARVRCFTGAVKPTSTLLVVAGLARPEFLVEISARAVLRS